MNEEELANLYQNYAWYASQCRGSVLNEIIMMERLMDDYICSYFCENDEKRRELMAIVMCTEKVTFESKRQVFVTILERRDKAVYTKHKKTLKYFSDIMEERNKLAHYMLLYTPEADKWLENKQFTLTKFKNTVTSEIFGEERITTLINKVHHWTEIIIGLHPIFGPSAEPHKITSPSGSDTPAPE